jgi:hypothetical protein
MSLNKYEQGLFDYLEQNPEERRHWQAKVSEAARLPGDPGTAARGLERELWEYFAERSQHVARLRDLNAGGLRRVSLQNLSEYLLRMFGPPVRPGKPGRP